MQEQHHSAHMAFGQFTGLPTTGTPRSRTYHNHQKSSEQLRQIPLPKTAASTANPAHRESQHRKRAEHHSENVLEPVGRHNRRLRITFCHNTAAHTRVVAAWTPRSILPQCLIQRAVPLMQFNANGNAERLNMYQTRKQPAQDPNRYTLRTPK